jgi:N-acetylmuramate 1-kinase
MTQLPLSGPARDALAAWLAARGYALAAVESLSGDVSPRRYARLSLQAPPTAILAVYPPEIAATAERFARTTAILERAGVRVPAILERDASAGWMLLEDVGPATLHDQGARGWEALAPCYESALGHLERIRGLPPAPIAALSPPLDAPLMERELRQTWELFLQPRGLLGGPSLERRLADFLAELCARVAAAGAVPCHRDFMPRNLVPLAGGPEVAVLDHQDLRLGPPAYDLAALLNDSLFPPPPVEARLLDAARRLEVAADDYHRAAVQRTLKAVGTYASFARRGADRHLVLIPPTLGAALRHLAALPEGGELAAALAPLWARAAPG